MVFILTLDIMNYLQELNKNELLEMAFSKKINIPTIGIGAGVNCDGQVLVTNDLLGLFKKFVPKFVKQYANLYKEIEEAIKTYINEDKDSKFPQKKHTFEIDDEVLAKLKQ